MINIDLQDTVAIVTGANGGIGAGIVDRLVAAGASVVVHYRRTPPDVQPPGTHAVQLDLDGPDAADDLVASAIETFGRVDALINNAAVQTLSPLLDMGDDEWAGMQATNVTAVHRLTNAFAHHVIERGGTGSAVHIASIEGLQPAPDHGHYAVSKAALIMLGRAQAAEFGPHGIRVNTVSPGLTDRAGLADAWPEGVQRWTASAPLGRLGTATDIGNACAFLCSPLAGFVTGANLVVDGGVSTKPTW